SQVADAARTVRGSRDVRIQERSDYPVIQLDLDRTRVATLGLSTAEVVKNLVTTLNSSVNFDPAFWIDETNGNHYFVGAQYREEAIDSIDTILDIPLTGSWQRHAATAMEKMFRPASRPESSNGSASPVLVRNIDSIERTFAPAEMNHRNITRVIDLYANVDGRDIGSVAAEIEKKLAGKKWPEGYFVRMRGEVASMRESFAGMTFGFALAVVL